MADRTYSYSGDPSTSEKDEVRFMLHDTKDEKWLFSDEEIKYSLKKYGNPFSAAAELALIQSASYTDRRDKTVGPLSIKYGEISDRWVELAKSLRSRGSRAGGAVAIMTQRPRPAHVRLGMHDNRRVADPWYLDPRDVTNYREDDDEFPDVLDGGEV